MPSPNGHVIVSTYSSYVHNVTDGSLLVVPSEPRSLEIISVNSSSVTLQWRPPEIPNGIITHYSILYGAININFTDFDNNMLMYTVEGLSPDTVYVLQLRAHTGAGAGPLSRITFLTCKLTVVVTWHESCLIFLSIYVAI